MHIKDSIAVITGGSQGLGRAFCRELLKKGAKIACIDVNETAGKKFLAECNDEFGKDKVHFIACDVTDASKLEGAFEETISKFGKLDLVCNNAGGAAMNWKAMVNLNLSALIHGTHLGIKHMGATSGGNGGLIINVASMAGLQPFPLSPVYTATKHAVVGFSRSFKGTLIEEKMRVNCICPSFAPTDLVKTGVESSTEMKKFVDFIGLVSIQSVADGFMQLVNDDEKDGAVLAVTPQGTSYIKTRHEEIPVPISQL